MLTLLLVITQCSIRHLYTAEPKNDTESWDQMSSAASLKGVMFHRKIEMEETEKRRELFEMRGAQCKAVGYRE